MVKFNFLSKILVILFSTYSLSVAKEDVKTLQIVSTDIRKEFKNWETKVLNPQGSASEGEWEHKNLGLSYKTEIGEMFFFVDELAKQFGLGLSPEEKERKIEDLRIAWQDSYYVPYYISVQLQKDIGGCPEGTIYRESTNKPMAGITEYGQAISRYLGHKDDGLFLPDGNSSWDALENCFELLSLGTETGRMPLDKSTPRKETLYLTGSQHSAPASFNPLAESWAASWPVGGRFNLMYEPLLVYNSLTAEMEPLLGKLIEDQSNNETIVVELNPAAKWSDGKKVSSKDVIFSFFKGNTNVTEIISNINVESSKNKAERLLFKVNENGRNNPLLVYDLLQSVHIVPSHVYEPLVNQKGQDEVKRIPMDKNPVVSGPYNLMQYGADRIVLKRRDDYWGNDALHNGKKPAPKYIVHPIFAFNEELGAAIRDGLVDASISFIPRIQRKVPFGVRTWSDRAPYFTPAAMPMLMINTTKPPLDDKVFRRAMATAINYDVLSKRAISGYSPQMQPGLINPYGLEKKYVRTSDLQKYGTPLNFDYDSERKNTVQRMLSSIGIKSVWNDEGKLSHMEMKGSRLPTLKITCPAGWTDWEAMVNNVVLYLRYSGIDIEAYYVDGGRYWPDMGLGYFDLVIHKPAADVTPSLPWSRFNEVMGQAKDWQPIGSWAGTNIGRYNDPNSSGYRPEIDRLLGLIPLMDEENHKIAAYRKLNQIFMDDQPAIPLAYLPEQFYEYSDKVWTGWPNEKNPYAPAMLPWVGSATNILWHLKLK